MRMIAAVAMGLAMGAHGAGAACCYFSAKGRDVNQPGQKAFITWDPESRRETFTVQPRFEGNALDFGMVIPTPTQPKLDEVPRDFFKHLALYTILLPLPQKIERPWYWDQLRSAMFGRKRKTATALRPMAAARDEELGVRVLEAGVVGTLDYKIITAQSPRGLYEWLRLNGYNYAGDEATLEHYIRRQWMFTVMKIDTQQMKKNPDGSYLGEVTPTRFSFASDRLVYPLKITEISVPRSTETLFYVQAPSMMDLRDAWSWMWSYRVMWLTSGTVCMSQKRMTAQERQELSMRQNRIARIRQEIPQFDTTKLEWARRLTTSDLAVLDDPWTHYRQGGFPDLPKDAKVVSVRVLQDEFATELESGKGGGGRRRPVETTGDHIQHYRESIDALAKRYAAAKGVIVRRYTEGNGGSEFFWFPHREAPPEEFAKLSQLKGFLKEGECLTKFRKTFLKHEMDRDLEIVPVPQGQETEYVRILPQSPP